MLSAEEIRNITFSKAMNGYKREEVDILLDKVESDYEQFKRQIRLLQEKTAELQKQIADNDSSKDSIQTVLLSAQKLADQIIADAKLKAEEMLNNADRDLAESKQDRIKQIEELDRAIFARKSEAEAQIDQMLEDAKRKSDAMLAAADDSIVRQQALFDKMHLEASAFKNEILIKSKDFLTVISKLPDMTPLDAKRAAAAVEEIYLQTPNAQEFVDAAQSQNEQASEQTAEEQPSEPQETATEE